LRDQWSLLIMSGWRLSEDVVRDDDVLWLVSRMKELNFQPGERHLYSNTGYTLLAQIVKRVSGKSLREFTREEFFEPLGMRSTHFRDDHREVVKGMAFGYEPYAGAFRESIPHYDTVGASSLLTTVEDLARWQRNFESPEVGGKAMIEAMLQTFTLNDGSKIDYRFGLTVGSYRGLPVIEHNGADAGYRSALVRFPEQRLSVACLCNTVANAGKLAHDVAEVYLGDKMSGDAFKPPPASKPETRAAVAKEEYAGRYYAEEIDSIYEIKFHDGALTLHRKKNLTHQLAPGAADTFTFAGMLSVHFERGDGGRITALRLSDGRVLNLKFVRL
jgi:hypothetical protein